MQETSKNRSRFIKSGSRKEKKASISRTASKFITYGGYIPELNMFLNDSYYFKVYLLKEPVEEELFSIGRKPSAIKQKQEKAGFPEWMVGHLGLTMYPGLKIQLIASKHKIYGVIGLKAELPEDAEEQFKKVEESWKPFPCPVISCEEWFSVMANRLRFSSFDGIPEGKRGKKATAIRLIQPHDVKIRQKDMEISGHTVKTLILMGYPSTLFPAFATELLEISDKLTLAVFAEELDARMCLDGVNLSTEIRVTRKEVMKDFLKRAINEGIGIYNTCALVTMEGLPGEVDEIGQKLKVFCKKYLILASELDYQQADAYRSTLPLLKNYIQYYRVLTESNLRALLPWSVLSRCKKNICYGKDRVIGDIRYDRRIYHENGFILSSNYDWALIQAKKEAEGFSLTKDIRKNIYFLTREDKDLTIFDIDKRKTFKRIKLSYNEAPGWLIRAAVIRWSVHGLSTNGQVVKHHMDMVMKAAEILPDEEWTEDHVLSKESEAIGDEQLKKHTLLNTHEHRSPRDRAGLHSTRDKTLKEKEDKCRVNEYIEQFLSQMGENEQCALSVRPFISEYTYCEYPAEYGVFYSVEGNGVRAELAYALLFNQLHGIVYSLNSELLAWNAVDMFRLHEDCLYTFLTQDNRKFYESKCFKTLLKDAPFLLIGEHKIFDKLKLSALVGLDKKQREWISEPAKGSLLLTRLVTYQLKEDREIMGEETDKWIKN